MEFEVPKRHILRPTLSIDMLQRILQWERQRSFSSWKRQGPWQRNVILIFLFLFFAKCFCSYKERMEEEEGEEGEKVKQEEIS